MRENIKLIGSLIGISLSIFLISFFVFAQSTWQGPTSSPPGGNVPAPLSSGTENQFKEGALGIGGVFQTDSETHLSTQGGNVGIGTTNPGAKLHTSLDTHGTHIQIERTGESPSIYTMRNSGNFITHNYSASGFSWEFNGTERLRLTNNGNVGIGTTTPQAKLDVIGTIMASNIGQWGFKEAPLSWSSAYINNWDRGGGGGDSIDCVSSAQGCTILKDGTYEIRYVQRANGTGSAYGGVALNGSRSALEDRVDAMWNHDHAEDSSAFTESNFMGTLSANDFITAGPPTTTHRDRLHWRTSGWAGSISINRID